MPRVVGSSLGVRYIVAGIEGYLVDPRFATYTQAAGGKGVCTLDYLAFSCLHHRPPRATL
jgi:hypothetical protein